VNDTGLGVDIEEVDRFRAMLARWGRRFTERVFTGAEIAYCERQHEPAQHFAARFAAKEAFGKAVGTGWSGIFAWRDVEIERDADGRPSIRLHGELARRYGGLSMLVSLSHTRRLATATVLVRQLPQQLDA
jgi:holo-[acyl-carrier protein] synthase